MTKTPVKKAVVGNAVIAESDATVVVEGNHYFPPESVHKEHLKKSGNTYTCSWKGVCDYYDVVVGGVKLKDAAWMYPKPTSAAGNIKGYFAFWHGVRVIEY